MIVNMIRNHPLFLLVLMEIDPQLTDPVILSSQNGLIALTDHDLVLFLSNWHETGTDGIFLCGPIG